VTTVPPNPNAIFPFGPGNVARLAGAAEAIAATIAALTDRATTKRGTRGSLRSSEVLVDKTITGCYQ
jgi:hypothetical protein